ncbi:hypothetical protein F4780DRAFT_389712 [Xylariomycetidae sp. FL0641]|nr:hypothetical protein F4780DRAFT_189531 [Xylariomycetidae sp. FL0641]KAI0020101.1 hypothetical protein F4780DRAFT_389712 [Xylariomycetidae sp. FL0641]
MPATFVIAYPKGSNINMDYYLHTHMAKVADDFRKAGMTSWRVARPAAEEDVPALAGSPYEVMTLLQFPGGVDAIKALLAALTPDQQQALADDLKNYSLLPPVRWILEDAASA